MTEDKMSNERKAAMLDIVDAMSNENVQQVVEEIKVALRNEGQHYGTVHLAITDGDISAATLTIPTGQVINLPRDSALVFLTQHHAGM